MNHRLAVLRILLIAAVGMGYAQGRTGSKTGFKLSNALAQAGDHDRIVAWVFFADKGRYEALRSAVPRTVVSERSIRRRRKVRNFDRVLDYGDLPLEDSYVRQVASRVAELRNRSKWFNAVSITATKKQISNLENLTFVRQIDLLARFRRNGTEDFSTARPAGSGPLTPLQPRETHSFNYGASLGQINQINVPAVHDLGNYAQGVLVGVFDNGFRLPTHEALAAMNVIATYDFVDHKVSVVPNNPSPSFGSHGVNTLSTIGGYKEGQLIGPAFGASFILARTENDSSETPMEEDNWVAAIEWADSIGVDVTSTSLGYLTFDSPYPSLTWQDMDGHTAVITRAAVLAAGRGIVVVNSAGNSGNNASHNTLNAPADGDSVLTVGAVDGSGTRSSFSSVGPTTSIPPRIKPDVMAQGSSVYVASATNPTGYGYSNGTSFSCPLAAGVAALVVKARPAATPIQVINAMRSTASHAATPDNLHGWGIINALNAISSIPLPVQLEYLIASPTSDSCVRVEWRTLSEINNYGFEVQRSSRRPADFRTLPNSFIPGHGTTNEPHLYSFRDCPVSPGIWWYRLKYVDLDTTVHYTDPICVDVPTSVTESPSPSFALHQNYPNPFNPETHIEFRTAHPGFVSMRVFDVLGREVQTLVDEVLPAGSHTVRFDGSALSGGPFFYRIQAGGFTATRAMLLLK